MGTFVSEPVTVPGRISSAAIIDDLLSRLGEKLARNGDLRPVDSYSGYSARVVVELDLHDVDTVSVSQTMTIGTSPASGFPAAA